MRPNEIKGLAAPSGMWRGIRPPWLRFWPVSRGPRGDSRDLFFDLGGSNFRYNIAATLEPAMNAPKASQRYELKRLSSGAWAVIDLFTGRPAVELGIPLTGIEMDEADDLTDLLNARERKRIEEAEGDEPSP